MMTVQVFWNVTSCMSMGVLQHLEGVQCIHLQSEAV